MCAAPLPLGSLRRRCRRLRTRCWRLSRYGGRSKAMRCPGWVLEQDDSGVVVASVVERPSLDVWPVTSIAAVPDDPPGREDAFPSGQAQLRHPRRRGRGGLGFACVAQRNHHRLAAGELFLVDIAPPAPVVGRAVVVMKLHDDVVPGAVTEGDGPGARLSRAPGAPYRRASDPRSAGLAVYRISVHSTRAQHGDAAKDDFQAAHRQPPCRSWRGGSTEKVLPSAQFAVRAA